MEDTLRLGFATRWVNRIVFRAVWVLSGWMQKNARREWNMLFGYAKAGIAYP